MAECLAHGGQGQHIQSAGCNSALQTLFYKLSMYLKSPIILIFVYDGPQRPNIKRGIHVRTQSPTWVEPSKRLVSHFGFHTLQVRTAYSI